MNAKRILFSIASLFFTVFIFSCTDPQNTQGGISLTSKDELVVVTDLDVPGHFVINGTDLGYHYDILHSYAENLNIKLRFISDATSAECCRMLLDGRADIVVSASQISTDKIKSYSVYKTGYSVLTTNKEARDIRQAGDFSVSCLIGKKVLMTSGFCLSKDYDAVMDSLKNKEVETYSSSRDAFELSSYIVSGDYDFLICEDSEAHAASTFNIGLTDVYSFTDKVDVYFSVGSNIVDLSSDFERWFADYSVSNEYYTLASLYHKGGLISQLIGKTVGVPRLQKGIISEYDYLMQAVCNAEGIDWRLMSAICYNESRFQSDVVSRSGAKGLMQIMPIVARHFGVSKDDIMDPAVNIMLAGKLIKEIERSLKLPSNISQNDRISIILAAYNGGIGHVQDARRLARKYGYSPNSWESVSLFLKRKSLSEYSNDAVVKNGSFHGSSETIGFVSGVMNQYALYCAKINTL